MLLTGALVGACGQRYEGAMQLICDAPRKSSAAEYAPANRMEVVARWVDENVTHDKARALFASLGEMDLARRSEALAIAAREAGIERCVLAIEYAPGEPAR